MKMCRYHGHSLSEETESAEAHLTEELLMSCFHIIYLNECSSDTEAQEQSWG